MLLVPVDAAEALRVRLRAHIAASRASDGGWGTVPGRTSDIESSAWVLTGAARLPELAEFLADSRRWLLQQQQADGSWLFRVGPSIATWPTHAAAFALQSDSANRDDGAATASAVARAIGWIVREHSVTPTTWQRFIGRVRSAWPTRTASTIEPPVVLDATLDGFGWAHETFAWVEPTSIAMMAMARTPAPLASSISKRLGVGLAMLLDRQSPDGGWNFGNKRVLGVDLPGYPDTTAWAILGLSAALRTNVANADTISSSVSRALSALGNPESPTISPLPTALEILARIGVHQRDATRLRTLRDQLIQTTANALDGVRDGYPMLETRTAVFALCALAELDLFAPASATRVGAAR